MATRVARGGVWMYDFRHPDKRRPVVVLSRNEAIRALHTVMVAPVTSTIRGIPSEVGVGLREGLKHESVVNLDHVQTIERARLARCIGRLDARKLRAVCRALNVATGCTD